MIFTTAAINPLAQTKRYRLAIGLTGYLQANLKNRNKCLLTQFSDHVAHQNEANQE